MLHCSQYSSSIYYVFEHFWWLLTSRFYCICFLSNIAQWLRQTLLVDVQMEDYQVVQPLVLCCRCEKCQRSRATNFDKPGSCEEKATKLGTISFISWWFGKHSKYDRRLKDCEIRGLARTPCKSLVLNCKMWFTYHDQSITVGPDIWIWIIQSTCT